jgi:hypothetical protein
MYVFRKKDAFCWFTLYDFFYNALCKNIKFVTVNIGGPQTYKNDLM